MSGVDQYIDALGGEIGRKTLGSAKSTGPHRHRLFGRRGGSACERKSDRKIMAMRKPAGQLPRFGRAAQDENMPHDG